jgi:KDO2-lipid IV(A) lauroyltransferase
MGEEHPATLNRENSQKSMLHSWVDFIKEYPEMWLWSHRRWKWEWKPEYGEIIN